MECAGRALSGDGALAPGVANSVLIEAITCAGRSANGFTASSPEHTQNLRTLAKDKTWLPSDEDGGSRNGMRQRILSTWMRLRSFTPSWRSAAVS